MAVMKPHLQKERYAVTDDTVIALRQGARKLLAQAVEAEVTDFLSAHADLTTEDGRQRLVRHGHLRERTIQTGIGPVDVQQPRVRDRGHGEKIRFSPAILPRYARRSKSLDALIPILYLRGISSGDFQEALSALLGEDAPNLSPAVLGRLKAAWKVELERWQQRDLSARRYVYIWADGVYLQARMEVEKQCILVLIGPTPEGRDDAEKTFDRFLAKYQAKYDKAADCLAKDRDVLLAFYDVPAKHWKHIRTGNPIESTFATVRHRTVRSKGCLSYETAKIMVFKTIQAAQKSWRKLDGQNQLPKVTDGIETVHDHAAA